MKIYSHFFPGYATEPAKAINGLHRSNNNIVYWNDAKLTDVEQEGAQTAHSNPMHTLKLLLLE